MKKYISFVLAVIIVLTLGVGVITYATELGDPSAGEDILDDNGGASDNGNGDDDSGTEGDDGGDDDSGTDDDIGDDDSDPEGESGDDGSGIEGDNGDDDTSPNNGEIDPDGELEDGGGETNGDPETEGDDQEGETDMENDPGTDETDPADDPIFPLLPTPIVPPEFNLDDIDPVTPSPTPTPAPTPTPVQSTTPARPPAVITPAANIPSNPVITDPPLSIYGNIVAESPGTITVADPLNQAEGAVILHISSSTYVLDALTGETTSLDMRTGDRVAAFYGPRASRSAPLQSNAVAIVINLPEGRFSPNLGVVYEVGEAGEGVGVLLDGGPYNVLMDDESIVLSYPDGIETGTQSIRLGSMVMFWFDLVEQVAPPRAYADFAVIVRGQEMGFGAPAGDGDNGNHGRTVIYVSLSSHIAIINNNEIQFENMLLQEDGNHLYPLRLITEALGYNVSWFYGDLAAEITGPGLTLMVSPGIAISAANGIPFAISKAPVLISGRVLVPLDFFSSGLGLEIVS